MILHDICSDKDISLLELYNDYIRFKSEDTYNHADNFKTEYHEILMATINGRNDFDIVGYTGKEISNIIFRIRKTLKE